MQDAIYPARRVLRRSPQAGSQETLVPRREPDLRVRTASSEDEQGLRRMFSRLSPQSIYLRFHIPYPKVPEWAVTSFIESNRPRKEILLAVVGEEVAGHAMYVLSDEGRDAEFAIVVEDQWQSKGVGKFLLSRLAEEAQRRSVETFSGFVLLENRRMLGLIKSVFSEATYTIEGGAYHIVVPLDSPEAMPAA
jgi:GNAT superfamily N-acetyltransferase